MESSWRKGLTTIVVLDLATEEVRGSCVGRLVERGIRNGRT